MLQLVRCHYLQSDNFEQFPLTKVPGWQKLYAEVDHEIQQPLGCKLLSFEFASPDQVRSLEPILLITESSRRSVFPQGMSDLEIKRPLSLRHVRGNPSRSRDIERVPTLLCQPHALDDFLPAYHDLFISHF